MAAAALLPLAVALVGGAAQQPQTGLVPYVHPSLVLATRLPGLRQLSARWLRYSFPNAGKVLIRQRFREGGAGTGSGVWSASRLLAAHLDAHPGLVRGREVVELGAGLGLPSVVAARLGAARVLATDGEEAVTEMLGDTLRRSRLSPSGARAALLRWDSDEDRARVLRELPCGGAEVVLAADVVYAGSRPSWGPLLAALRYIASDRALVLVAHTHRYPQDTADFASLVRESGFGLHETEGLPEGYPREGFAIWRLTL
eukprot:TRINITY_DN44991_c0_g1_i1.p2 TRINITY_DN44991_c0_g1~~TRINITY_DN44991_c0_g1_i1.p2  ORF type:complete len:280 (+),score=78.87 TRINITY_DN44991_c0_g1_i1:72-842(+)